MHPTILLMAKAPRPSFVKTRLAAQIGPAEATDLYRRLVERQIRDIPTAWPLEVHFAPEDAEVEMRAWLGAGPKFVPQVDGDLGARLSAAFDHAFTQGARTAIAIGGDCPELGVDDFHQAAGVLQRKDVVLGPACDGGYYLIGLRGPAPFLFAHMPWSTPEVLSTTVDRLEQAGLSLELLGVKEDVDDSASMWRAASRLGIERAD